MERNLNPRLLNTSQTLSACKQLCVCVCVCVCACVWERSSERERTWITQSGMGGGDNGCDSWLVEIVLKLYLQTEQHLPFGASSPWECDLLTPRQHWWLYMCEHGYKLLVLHVYIYTLYTITGKKKAVSQWAWLPVPLTTQLITILLCRWYWMLDIVMCHQNSIKSFHQRRS